MSNLIMANSGFLTLMVIHEPFEEGVICGVKNGELSVTRRALNGIIGMCVSNSVNLLGT